MSIPTRISPRDRNQTDKSGLTSIVYFGAPCLLLQNSLLQSLYHLGAFREGVLAAAAAASVSRSSATVELGRTFAMLSSSSSSGGSGAGRTAGLCRSLGVDVRLQVGNQGGGRTIIGSMYLHDMRGCAETSTLFD